MNVIRDCPLSFLPFAFHLPITGEFCPGRFLLFPHLLIHDLAYWSIRR